MTASLASVLMQTQVLFTANFSYLPLRERASRQLQAGLLVLAELHRAAIRRECDDGLGLHPDPVRRRDVGPLQAAYGMWTGFVQSRRRRAQRTTVTPAWACRMEGMTSTQSS